MSGKLRVTGKRPKLAFALAVVLILSGWQLAAGLLPDFLMPGVAAVVARLGNELQGDAFLAALAGSLGRLAAGYGIALVTGVGFGLAGARPEYAQGGDHGWLQLFAQRRGRGGPQPSRLASLFD